MAKLIVRVPDGLTGYEVIVYAYLVSMNNPVWGEVVYVYPECIARTVGLIGGRSTQDITAALSSLFTKGVEGGKIEGTHIYWVYLGSLWVSDHFTAVPYEYIIDISSSGYHGKDKLVTFYLTVLKTRDHTTKTGRYSYAALGELAHCSPNTVGSYMTALERLGVLRIRHTKGANGLCNTYGLPEDLKPTKGRRSSRKKP